ncbi:MAG: outer rane transport energization protein ExbB [Nitrosospira multiformis]|jgi:biopolymer transport protein ExbB|nr:outer rane transport energization protein ExbB [Nitrosospira multiformis]
MRFLPFLLAFVLSTWSFSSYAWWNEDWTSRKKITLTGPSSEVTDVPVLIRLHTGNFDFFSASDNGGDVRLVAGGDKTELKFHFEKWDVANELALIWVKVLRLSAQTEIFLYYGNENATSAADPKGTYDASSAIYHFAESQGNPQDSGSNNLHAQSSAQHVAASFSNGGAGFDGAQSLILPPVQAAGGYSFSVWIKPASLSGIIYQSGSVNISLDGGLIKAQSGGASAVSEQPFAAGQWHHVGFTISDALRLYIDGKAAGEARNAVLPAGTVTLGGRFKGEMDEAQVSGLVRAAEWIAVQAALGPDGKLVVMGEEETIEGGSDASHMGIILKSLTVDGWVAIGLLTVMLLIAIWVMYSKAVYINRVDKSNNRFMDKFRELSTDLAMIDKAQGLGKDFEHSSLYRIYHIGPVELAHRFQDTDAAHTDKSLTPQSLDAIRASLDAGLVEEIQRMNRFMVLLTIAISGGPFIGLLGTVMGVMITFAAIAAAGDVNVNAIAPGIAAALAATVAGMGVAIPSLFGYNYLASRIKAIVSRMHIFVDEFITKLAENYSC